jgi:N-acetylneuraminic acid mutarotase
MVTLPKVETVRAVEDSWQTKRSMPKPDSVGIKGAVVDGKIFVIRFSPLTDTQVFNYEYDPAQNRWTEHTPPPTYENSPAIVGYEGKIWAFGGGQIQVYDPPTGSWSRKGTMSTERYNSVAHVVNGKFYIIGGQVPSTPPGIGYSGVKDIEVFDPVRHKWTTKNPSPNGVVDHASALLDEKIYIIDETGTQVYDTKTDTWSTASPCPYCPNWGASAAVTSGVLAPERIYVMGGYSGGPSVYDYNRVYNPENDSWSLAESMPTGLQGFVAVAVNDKIYTLGGKTGPNYPDFGGFQTDYTYQYTPIGYGTLDDEPPSVSIFAPKNVTYTTNSISLKLTANEVLSWIKYRLDNQPLVSLGEHQTLTELSEGTHKITAYACDLSGNNATSETIYFSVDSTLPNLSILSPENKTYNTNTVPLVFTEDGSASSLKYCLDGQENVSITGETHLTKLSDGMHSIVVYANDTAGNTGASELLYFSVNQQSELFMVFTAIIIILLGVGTVVLIYFTKNRKTTTKTVMPEEVP